MIWFDVVKVIKMLNYKENCKHVSILSKTNEIDICKNQKYIWVVVSNLRSISIVILHKRVWDNFIFIERSVSKGVILTKKVIDALNLTKESDWIFTEGHERFDFHNASQNPIDSNGLSLNFKILLMNLWICLKMVFNNFFSWILPNFNL